MNYLFYGWAILNLVSFLFFGLDKFKAKRQRWRISESTLFLCAFLGPLGASLGMYIFKHKTQKWIFKISIPLFLMIQLILVCFFYSHFIV